MQYVLPVLLATRSKRDNVVLYVCCTVHSLIRWSMHSYKYHNNLAVEHQSSSPQILSTEMFLMLPRDCHV